MFNVNEDGFKTTLTYQFITEPQKKMSENFICNNFALENIYCFPESIELSDSYIFLIVIRGVCPTWVVPMLGGDRTLKNQFAIV